MTAGAASRIPRWAWWALAGILIFDVWYRCHTIGPTIKERLGVRIWPVVAGRAEPLDCDEAAYAYIGRRIVRGDVMYRDLTENKPPGGYWLYALAVAIGGANELTIRLMPIPLVLATVALAWWLGLRLHGPAAGCLAAAIYAILSTDPFLFGNGANLEHAINLFATASLALMVVAISARGAWPVLAAGAFLGMACLVKQVAVLHLPLYILALLVMRQPSIDGRASRARVRAVLALAVGFSLVWAIALGTLILQGAGRQAFEDIVRYGGALATDTPAEPHAPAVLIRWITGNADPAGGLPPPFGKSRYLVWWGTGSWPLWLAAIPGLGWLLVKRPTDAARRLVAGWTISAWVQVALPGLFWQHYYLLPTPGVAVAVAVLCAENVTRARRAQHLGSAVRAMAVAGSTLAAILGTSALQARTYLGVQPEQLAVRYKGGQQWVTLRALSQVLADRTRGWRDPRLFLWGWQSPLFFYTPLDGVSPHFFTDPLLKAYAGRDHVLIGPRVARIMRDLRARPPELIFVGYPPFPELRDFLYAHYLRSGLVPQPPNGLGLWIVRERYREFEGARP